MGQGPYGPGPIWARAPGPSLLGEHLTKKRTLEKRVQIVFLVFFWKQKRCATSVRSFSTNFRAEISAMCQKTKVSVFEKIHNFVVICQFVNSPPGAGCERTPFAIKGTLTSAKVWFA